MKPIKKVLLLITLLIILAGVVSASEVSEDTSTGTGETVSAHTTNTISQKDTITKENNIDDLKTSTNQVLDKKKHK